MIKFVYFDIGGVAILDFSGTSKWEDLQKEIGLKPEQYENFEIFWDKYPDITTTRDVETLKPLMEKEFNIKFPEGYSLLIDGFINRFEANKSLWPVINKIHSQSKVGLLTNMYPNMLKEIRNSGLIPNINWDAIIDSSVVKFAKPNVKIFDLAEKESKVDKGSILFVDNTLGHIKAAQDFGWQTFTYDPTNPEKSSNDLLKYFEENK